MTRRRRRLIRAYLVWWVVLFWTAMLLFGRWSALELMAAGAIGALAAVAAVVVWNLAGPDHRLKVAWLRGAAGVPQRVVVDFGLVAWVLLRSLARRERPRGVFRARRFDVGSPGGPVAAGRRAWIGAAGGFSPNAYVVEFDAERQLVLVHDLVPRRASERPA